MRQAGILAAAALFALEHRYERLVEDHANAAWLAAEIQQLPGLSIVDPAPDRLVDTNIVLFEIDPSWGTAAEMTAKLAEHGVRCFPFSGTSIRFVTHLHISRADVEQVARVLQRISSPVAR
jgi:threonine aldolase